MICLILEVGENMENKRRRWTLALYFVLYLVFVCFILVTASISFFKETIDENMVDNLSFKTKGVEALRNGSLEFSDEYYEKKVQIKEKILQDEISEIFSIMSYASEEIKEEDRLDWFIDIIKNKEMQSDKFVWVTSSSGNFLASVSHVEDYQIINLSEKLISTFNDTKYINDIVGARRNRFWIDMYNPIHEKYTKNLVIAYYDRNYDIIVYVASVSEDFNKIRQDIDREVTKNMMKELTYLSDSGLIGYYDNINFEAKYYGGGYLENIYEDSDIQENESILQMIKNNRNQSFKYVVNKEKEYIRRIMYVHYSEKDDIYYFAGKDISEKYLRADKLQNLANIITITVVLICCLIGFKTWDWMTQHYFKKQRRIKKHLNLDDK
jgi:hypothetical protein